MLSGSWNRIKSDFGTSKKSSELRVSHLNQEFALFVTQFVPPQLSVNTFEFSRTRAQWNLSERTEIVTIMNGFFIVLI